MTNYYLCECGVGTIAGMECWNCGAVEPIGAEEIRRFIREPKIKPQKKKPRSKRGRPKQVFVLDKPWKEKVKEYKNKQC